MLCDQSSHVWLGRFSLRLMQLRPGLSMPRAVTRAVHAFALSSDLNPEQVATMDAAVLQRAGSDRGDRFGDHERARELGRERGLRSFFDRLRRQLAEATR
jgi:hypothetical protein